MHRLINIVDLLQCMHSIRGWIKVTGYPKKPQLQYFFLISQHGYPKRAFQDNANDGRIIISTSLNFAQIRKSAPKR